MIQPIFLSFPRYNDLLVENKRFRCLATPVSKGAGSYLAGMAVAIPILNVDGRRHTNNFNVKNINFKV